MVDIKSCHKCTDDNFKTLVFSLWILNSQNKKVYCSQQVTEIMIQIRIIQSMIQIREKQSEACGREKGEVAYHCPRIFTISKLEIQKIK